MLSSARTLVGGAYRCVHAVTYQCSSQVEEVTWTGRDSEADRRKWRDERQMRLVEKKKTVQGSLRCSTSRRGGERAVGVEAGEGLSEVCG